MISKLKNLFLKPEDSHRTLIGRLLKQKHLITDQQLERALEIQRERRDQLTHPVQVGMILVELGYATEYDVVQAINQHYRLSINSLSENVEDLIRKKYGSIFHRLTAHPVPIWLQIAIMMTIIVALTIFSLSLIMINQQREQLYQQTVKIGKVSLNYFANNARILLLEDNVLQLNTLINEATAVEGIRYAMILDRNRNIMAHTDHTRIGEEYIPFDNVRGETEDDPITYFDYYSRDKEHLLNLNRPVILQGTPLGEVHVGVSLDFIERLIHEKNLSVLLVSLGVTGVGIITAILLGFHFSRPISDLVFATREIRKGNYQYKVHDIRNDELGNLAIAFNQMSRELWIKSLMQKSFGKYVGAEVLEMIMVDPQSDWLKGRRSEATVLFTDIRGFTSYAKMKEPEAVVERLNEYFEIASEEIIRHGGYIDKFVGDAVLGVFGVPVFYEDHVERAVRAAVEMQKRFRKKAEQHKDTLLDVVGIGINTGIVLSGNIGSQMKMEYTVIGDTVNVASRLNGLAASGEIIVSRAVHDTLGPLLTAEKRPPQKIKGKIKPVEIFNVKDIQERKPES